MVRHGDQDRQQSGEASLAEQDDTRRVPRQRQAPQWRASLLRRSDALRAIPSLARFLTLASHEPGDARAGRDQAGRRPPDRDQASQDSVGQAAAGEGREQASRGRGGWPGRSWPR